MGYMHIDNLYKNQEILMLRECFAMEKIHGSSAHVGFHYNYDSNGDKLDPQINLFCGGCKAELFTTLWNKEELIRKFLDLGVEQLTIFGEGYGGKMQGMSRTYGKELKFVAFDVRIGENWLDVEKAHEICAFMDIDFVAYERVSTDLEDLDIEKNKPSVQAKRNGIIDPKMREGVVLRPIIELKKNNGARIICKHKRDEFMETSKPRKVQDPVKLEVLADAKKVSEEWVTIMRLSHVLDKIEEPSMKKMREIIIAMVEDIKREGDKEIVWSPEVVRAIGKATAKLTKQYFQNKLQENNK